MLLTLRTRNKTGVRVGIGEAMALGSAATWAVGVILARQLGVHLPPLALNLLKNGLVLAVLAPVALVLHAGAWPSLPCPVSGNPSRSRYQNRLPRPPSSRVSGAGAGIAGQAPSSRLRSHC